MGDSRTAGRTTEIAPGTISHEPGIDYTDGYRVTVGWSEEGQTWMAQVSGCAHENAALADGPTKDAALLSLACSLAALIDAVEQGDGK